MAYKVLKKILDFIFALLFIIILSPLLLLIAILILITSGKPVMFIYPRKGKNEKNFKIYKFRTLVNNAHKYERTGVKKRELKTGMGEILRPIHLDELPQLFNILKGEMSFIGPRPLSLYNPTQKTLKNSKVFSITPGLTSLSRTIMYSSLKKRTKIIKKVFNKKINIKSLNFDKVIGTYYCNNISFLLDSRILLWTLSLELFRLKRLFQKKK